MRILFVSPAVLMSIGDVSRGYRNALERQGHDIREYSLGARIAYHVKALPVTVAENMQVLSRVASECIALEALYHNADHVVIISGLNLHPIALWLLGKLNIPASVVFTESPYDDDHQARWTDLSHVDSKVDLTVFTNDAYSAKTRGWHYLPPAFDPAVHRLSQPIDELVCDVVMVGTGWPERQAFLEAVDWNGIDLRLYGIWNGIDADSPLVNFYKPQIVKNEYTASMYASARICINFNRGHAQAYTPGPRCYEIAACGAFQLSDPRPGLNDTFGDSVPVFRSPQELGELVRFYLANPDVREATARSAHQKVQGNTFDDRAATMMAAINPQHELQGV